MSVNIYEVTKIMQNKEKSRLFTYEKVLERANHRILLSAKNGEDTCFFQVPEYIVGLPVYKLDNCIKYLIFSLKKGGFQMQYYYPNVLQISWKKDKKAHTMIELNNDAKNGFQYEKPPLPSTLRSTNQTIDEKMHPPPPTYNPNTFDRPRNVTFSENNDLFYTPKNPRIQKDNDFSFTFKKAGEKKKDPYALPF